MEYALACVNCRSSYGPFYRELLSSSRSDVDWVRFVWSIHTLVNRKLGRENLPFDSFVWRLEGWSCVACVGQVKDMVAVAVLSAFQEETVDEADDFRRHFMIDFVRVTLRLSACNDNKSLQALGRKHVPKRFEPAQLGGSGDVCLARREGVVREVPPRACGQKAPLEDTPPPRKRRSLT